MAAEKSGSIPSAPLAPPPPRVPCVDRLGKGKNLVKSAATLFGANKTVVEESALNVCVRFLRRLQSQQLDMRALTWYFHNNDAQACLQDGPTCGLVALKVGADVLRKAGSLSECSSCGSDEIDRLLKLSKEKGFTYHGEIFSARDMALLAMNFYELKSKVFCDGLVNYEYFLEHLCQGYPVLVPYDSDRNHEPCLKNGHKAHWAVITGFLIGLRNDVESPTDENIPSVHAFDVHNKPNFLSFQMDNLFLIARHGKSRHYAVWSWVDLKSSNGNLFEYKCPSILGDDDKIIKTKVLLTEGVESGLCSKVVFLFPS